MPGNGLAHRRILQVSVGAATLFALGVVIGLLLRSSEPPDIEPPVAAEAEQWYLVRLTTQPGRDHQPSLTPDGEWLVYAADTRGNWDVFLRSLDGDNPINLTPDCRADDTDPVVSPDGRTIAFRSERDGGGIFLMGLTGESVRRVSDVGYNPSWGNKSKRIVYATGKMEDGADATASAGELWTIELGMGTRVHLESGPAVQPAWSPKGVRVAYAGSPDRAGQWNIWTVSAAGGKALRATGGSSRDWSPTWSPDGRFLYFTSDRAGRVALWRVPIDEESGEVLGPEEAVTTGGTAWNLAPRFSRDGRRLVFTERLERTNISRVPVDDEGNIAGPAELLTSDTRAGLDPVISPDGQWIAFASALGEDLFVQRVGAASVTRLAPHGARDRHPRWSPDGQRLAFVSDRSGGDRIWLVGRDGAGPAQLAGGDGRLPGLPTWSPDGRLTFSVAVAGDDGRLFVFDLNDRNQTPQVLCTISGDSLGIEVSDWSRDGRRLAVNLYGERSGPAGVGLVDISSSRLVRLTDFGMNPAWTPDGKRLAFLFEGSLHAVDVESRDVRSYFSASPAVVRGLFSFTADGDYLVVALQHEESDIWMLEKR